MKFARSYSLHHGDMAWTDKGLDRWLSDIFDAPSILVQRGSTPQIRQHVRTAFTSSGWSDEFRIANGYELTLFSLKDDLAFQLQTGNMSRAPYDLLKLQYLYLSGRINAAGIALPTREAAVAIGENIVSADRIWNEMRLFDRIITVPVFLIAFN